jgi:cobalt/nickel transport system ATP-binding protein
MSAAIEISNLQYSYPDGRAALRGLSLRVERGDSAAIVGPNGAGKSTLLLHLNGLLPPQNGSVKIHGMPVAAENFKEIRRRVGLVFQNPDDQLFCVSVFDDVAFGPLNLGLGPEDVRDRVSESLVAVGISGYEERSPHHLSFGEKKLVAIATVLSMRPDILAFDEPSSNLDPRASYALMETINALKATKLIVTHDLAFARATTKRTAVINEGRIVAEGPTERILSDAALLRANGLAADVHA